MGDTTLGNVNTLQQLRHGWVIESTPESGHVRCCPILVGMFLISWLARLGVRRDCFHHERNISLSGEETATSWIRSELVDLGRRKIFWCTVCKRKWI